MELQTSAFGATHLSPSRTWAFLPDNSLTHSLISIPDQRSGSSRQGDIGLPKARCSVFEFCTFDSSINELFLEEISIKYQLQHTCTQICLDIVISNFDRCRCPRAVSRSADLSKVRIERLVAKKYFEWFSQCRLTISCWVLLACGELKVSVHRSVLADPITH